MKLKSRNKKLTKIIIITNFPTVRLILIDLLKKFDSKQIYMEVLN